MNRFTVVAAGILLGSAGQLLAQDMRVVDQRVAGGQPEQFTIPLCNMKLDSKLSNVQRLIKSGIEEKAPDKRQKALSDARNTISGVLQSDPTSGAAWYYLGRYHLILGDMVGLDSAWNKALEILPDCEPDMLTYRQNAWAILANAAIEKQGAGDVDSAMVLFHRANFAFRGLPHVYMNMGVVFANQAANDSAAVYFAKAAEVAKGDTTLVQDRDAALLNLAAIYNRLGNHRGAINALGDYMITNPGDNDALRQLAVSYRELGMADSAEVLEGKLLTALSEMNLDDLDANDLVAVGVGFFNANKFDRAADAFRRATALNPFDRDALYNLANAYLAMKSGPQLESTGQQLVAMEPLSEDALRLFLQGIREQANREADLIRGAEKLISMPVSLDVQRVSYTASEGRVAGLVTGRDAVKPDNSPIPPAPITIVFEFVDIQGSVAGSHEVQIPALKGGETHSISFAAPISQGVAGWRYRIKQ